MSFQLIFYVAVLLSVVPLNSFLPKRFKVLTKRKIKRLKYQKYQAYLQSSKWKSLRNRTLARDKHQCQNRSCGSSENLEVHHLTYKRLCKERLSDLKTLCRNCHKKEHGRKR